MDVVKEIDYHATCLSIHCPAYLTHLLKKYNLFAQSICTYNSCFKKTGWFVTLKKRSKIWVAKSRVQKTRISAIQKEKKQPGLFSF